MIFLDRYFDLFEGQPEWLMWVISIFLVFGIFSIMRIIFKFSVWLFLFVLVVVAAVVGLDFFFGS